MTQKTQKIQGTFYALTPQLLQKLRGAKPSLTAAQWNLWAYINTINHETEIIEVKNIKDWKSALGQILTYSAYYPDHRKRIHLFGENLDKLPDIESACLPFNVIVTGEEVKND